MQEVSCYDTSPVISNEGLCSDSDEKLIEHTLTRFLASLWFFGTSVVFAFISCQCCAKECLNRWVEVAGVRPLYFMTRHISP